MDGLELNLQEEIMNIPINPDTQKPYFSIPEQGWESGGWTAGTTQFLDEELNPIPSNSTELKLPSNGRGKPTAECGSA